MRAGPLAMALLLASIAAAAAQNAVTVATLLRDGYEIKTAFYDNGGGAYIILQRGTSAFMCHSSPSQVCEKLN